MGENSPNLVTLVALKWLGRWPHFFFLFVSSILSSITQHRGRNWFHYPSMIIIRISAKSAGSPTYSFNIHYLNTKYLLYLLYLHIASWVQEPILRLLNLKQCTTPEM
jgi:hypothetical protein